MEWLGHPIQQLPSDPEGQMFFLSDILHERAGRNPRYARYHREALEDEVAAGGRPYQDRVVHDREFPNKVWQGFEEKCKGKPNKKNSYGPVAGTLKMLHGSGSADWVDIFSKKSPEEAWKSLVSLNGVGRKLACLVLREFQTFFKVWPDVGEQLWWRFQPVDRWVLQAAKLTWCNDESLTSNLDTDRSYKNVASAVPANFDSLQDSMDFNMGAWFLNAMRSEVMAVHGQIVVGADWDYKAFHRVAEELDPDLVIRAMMADFPQHVLDPEKDKRAGGNRIA